MDNEALERGMKYLHGRSEKSQTGPQSQWFIVLLLGLFESMKEKPEERRSRYCKYCKAYHFLEFEKCKDPIRAVYDKWISYYNSTTKYSTFSEKEMWNAIKQYCEKD